MEACICCCRYSEEINYRSPFGYPDAQQELSDRDDRLDNAGDYLLGNSRGGHQLTGLGYFFKLSKSCPIRASNKMCKI